MSESKEETKSSSFHLRPSILSGGTMFGSPSKCDGIRSPKKDFLLRPSALSSAAGSQENKLEKDVKKRAHEEDVKVGKDVEEESTEHLQSTKKPKVSGEVADKEAELKLTEDIKKPTGIGTFGFAQNDSSSDKTKDSSKETLPFKTPNYFEQLKNSNGDKLKFVFGSSQANTEHVGFSSIKNEANESEENNKTNLENTGGDEKNKLLENADEYQRAHGKQRQYEEVECFTGEEGEKHVLQVLCKLHIFDKDRKSWLEKGRGTLKLNDICQPNGSFQSRLVFRTQGTNIVQLNTLLYPDMCCEQVKGKSIRITAINPDTKDMDVFLISCNLKDRYTTFSAIERRIQAIQNHRNQANSQKTISQTSLPEEEANVSNVS